MGGTELALGLSLRGARQASTAQGEGEGEGGEARSSPVQCREKLERSRPG